MDKPNSTVEMHNFEEIKWTELENALSDLCLKWITIGEYVVVMNNKCDVTIGGEPYLVLQLWFNIKSGKIIKRIWDQTISSEKLAGVSHFVEVCNNHFKGRPCVGLPVPINEITWKNYLISQTPLPRKISRTCRKTLEPNTDKAIKSCPDCVMLNDSKLKDVRPSGIELQASENNYINEDSGIKDVAHQAIYLQEIAKKYPYILQAGKQFRIKIKTEDSNGCLQEKVLLVDPTQTLQQGGIVRTLSDENLNKPEDAKHQKFEEDKDLITSEQGLSHNDAGNSFEQHGECGFKPRKYETDAVEKYDDTEALAGPEVIADRPAILKDENYMGESPVITELKERKRKRIETKAPQTFNCQTCGKMCSSTQSLAQHRAEVHENEFSYRKKCEICSKQVSFNLFRRHMIKVHGQHGTYKIQCYWCKKSYSTTSYEGHVKKHHSVGRFLCEKCSFCGIFARELVDHVNDNHEGVTTVKCPSCKKDHPIDQLEDQYKKCIKNEFYGDEICSSCGKTLKGKKTLRNHQQFHCAQSSTLPEIFCDKCGKKFSSIDYLNSHIKLVHENFLIQCEFCPKTFNSKNIYSAHKNITHSTDPKYQCKFCGLRLGGLHSVRSHERKHQEPAFQCSFCEKKCTTKEGLKFHERQHTGEKPFKCSICDSGFASLGSLRQHESGVHKIAGPKGRAGGWWNKSKRKTPSSVLSHNEMSN